VCGGNKKYCIRRIYAIILFVARHICIDSYKCESDVTYSHYIRNYLEGIKGVLLGWGETLSNYRYFGLVIYCEDYIEYTCHYWLI
jgi:hypothetical protein